MTTTPEHPGPDPAGPPAPPAPGPPSRDVPRSPGPDVPRSPGPDVPGRPAVLTAEQLAVILRGRGPLTGAELDALARLDRAHLGPDDDDPGEDPGWGPPPEWLRLTAGEQRALPGSDEDRAGLAGEDPGEAEDPGEDPDPGIMDAGFTRHDPVPGAAGFAAGGPLGSDAARRRPGLARRDGPPARPGLADR